MSFSLTAKGGERAFRGASMFVEIEQLVIVDISEEIIRFNTINIELLKAKNKETYKYLRWEAALLDWQKISKILTKEDFIWWNVNVRNIKGYGLPEELNKYGSAVSYQKYFTIREKLMTIYPEVSAKFNAQEQVFLKNVVWNDIVKLQKNNQNNLTEHEFVGFAAEREDKGSCVFKFINEPQQSIDLGQFIDYKSGNYLFDDNLYKRLHDLVLKNKIIIVNADLTKLEDVNLLITRIRSLNTVLALLDLDNLYVYEYMGEEKFRIALDKLLTFGSKDSILILMHNYQEYACAQFSIYVGFTFENVRAWPKRVFFDEFINNLSAEMFPLIDGRLYTGKDVLPLHSQ